ncbi:MULTISPECIES: hypothetical protein [unclassified Desulfovibrio]|nr:MULTISPECIES: hypothetical protein [unclassified Desulfovibrio]
MEESPLFSTAAHSGSQGDGMSECVRCPVVGCVVEYLEGNAV